MAARDLDFYKRTLTKRLALLEKHPLRDEVSDSACGSIRAVLNEERPLEVVKVISRISGQVLKMLNLERKYGPISF